MSRQSFLGPHSETMLATVKVGIIGLSGGGSHIAQQLAHAGVSNFVVVDPQEIDGSNLNRLVGGTLADVKRKTPKVEIATRVIKSVNADAFVEAVHNNWQTEQTSLRDCSVIFGCVDSFSEREQLERFCRRFLISYIDIGMDVLQFDMSYRIVGQVILSSPGWACMRCIGVITEDALKTEAQKYGAAGSRPQVVWPNGVLASTAVGLFMQLICPWHQRSSGFAYLEYNGNENTLVTSPRAEHAINITCDHYKIEDVGDPLFKLSS